MWFTPYRVARILGCDPPSPWIFRVLVACAPWARGRSREHPVVLRGAGDVEWNSPQAHASLSNPSRSCHIELFAGRGGNGSSCLAGSGGAGGAVGSNGSTPNNGTGGGGGGGATANGPSGTGGSGVVIISTPQAAASTNGPPALTMNGSLYTSIPSPQADRSRSDHRKRPRCWETPMLAAQIVFDSRRERHPATAGSGTGYPRRRGSLTTSWHRLVRSS